jgi:myosin V
VFSTHNVLFSHGQFRFHSHNVLFSHGQFRCSFEQLCINYANEKLQDHFNYAIFKSEQEVYEEEGIKWVFTDYPDNSGRLELFEHKRTGLFLLCDEQLKIPKPSDDKLAQSFYSKSIAHTYFSFSKADKVKLEFVVNHFACDVKYNCLGFVDKNRNDVAQEIYDTFESSERKFVRDMPAATDDRVAKKSIRERSSSIENAAGLTAANAAGVGVVGLAPVRAERASSVSRQSSTIQSMQSVGKKKSVSLASQFSKQLSDLIQKIRSTRSHFIRCIKPNNKLAAATFDYEMVMNQLRSGGALGAVQVFHAGFPNRMDFKYFVGRYSAFLVICGVNALTKDLVRVIKRARATGSDDMWRMGSSMLIDIVALTFIVLNITDGETSEVAEEVDVLTGNVM